MKELLLIIGILAFCGCLTNDLNQNPSVESRKAVSNPDSALLTNRASDAGPIDNAKDKAETEEAVRRASENFDLQNLKDTTVNGRDLEVRFWVEKMSCALYCLVLRKQTQHWSVQKLNAHLRDDGGYEKSGAGKYLFTSETLNDERRKEKIDGILTKNDIRGTLPFSLESGDPGPEFDGGRIVLEVKDTNDYSIVFYRLSTESADGRRVAAALLELETSLGLGDKGCD